jgi:hypothetical protein
MNLKPGEQTILEKKLDGSCHKTDSDQQRDHLKQPKQGDALLPKREQRSRESAEK